jgi:hypothetical protein
MQQVNHAIDVKCIVSLNIIFNKLFALCARHFFSSPSGYSAWLFSQAIYLFSGIEGISFIAIITHFEGGHEC